MSGFKTKYYYKAKVVFECLKGFYLKGSNKVFCDASSIWEPEMPECIEGTKSVFFLLSFLYFISLTLNIDYTEYMKQSHINI